MGMFDDIVSEALHCPLCGARLSWQSKDGPCSLSTLTVHDLLEHTNTATIYDRCADCDVWVEVKVIRRTPPLTEAQTAQRDRDRGVLPVTEADYCDCGHDKRLHQALTMLANTRRGRCLAALGCDYAGYRDINTTSHTCPQGCDCSCCYGYGDDDCHCVADPCHCGSNRAQHGQKPLPEPDGYCTCHPDQKGRTADCGIAAHRASSLTDRDVFRAAALALKALTFPDASPHSRELAKAWLALAQERIGEQR